MPDWFDVAYLQKIKHHEREIETFAEELPYHYFEVAKLLLEACKDDELSEGNAHAADYKQLRSLVEDLYELRRDKVMRKLKNIHPKETPALCLDHVGAAELNYVRPALTNGITLADKFQTQVDDVQRLGK